MFSTQGWVTQHQRIGRKRSMTIKAINARNQFKGVVKSTEVDLARFSPA